MTIALAWTCPTCRAPLSTRYCPQCGESPPNPRDLTVRGLVRQIGASFTNIDGRLIRSFRCLLTSPGALTVAYVEGRRKPYIGPFQLFLIANVVFFATQSLTHGNVLSSTLHSHLHDQDWRALAQTLVARRLQATGSTLSVYSPVFDQANVLNAKSLIGLMMLPFALLLPLVFYRSRRPFVVHVVFSVHLYTFFLLLFCSGLVLAQVDVWLGGPGLRSPHVDDVLTVAILVGSAAYLYVAAGRVYAARGVVRGVQAIGLALATGCIVLGYRFALFLLTLYST
ncbi:MAG TPA: DUF3667 domain-containing protein [Longimicrobium sp.]|nr:DUF3667 domain-containing protein [Longimicrobium sp.]